MLLFGHVITTAPSTTSKPAPVERIQHQSTARNVALAPFTERHEDDKVVGGLDHYVDARLEEARFRID